MYYSNKYLLNACFNSQTLFPTKQIVMKLASYTKDRKITEFLYCPTCRISSLFTTRLKGPKCGCCIFTKTSRLKKKSAYDFNLISNSCHPISSSHEHEPQSVGCCSQHHGIQAPFSGTSGDFFFLFLLICLTSVMTPSQMSLCQLANESLVEGWAETKPSPRPLPSGAVAESLSSPHAVQTTLTCASTTTAWPSASRLPSTPSSATR